MVLLLTKHSHQDLETSELLHLLDMRYSKVEGNKSLIRDEETRAILNTNQSEYDNYITLRNIKKSEAERMQQLESDVSNMKNDLNEIKDLLRSIANKP